MPPVTPNPRWYRVLGRADEIARSAGSPRPRAEHLLLAVIHDAAGIPARVLAGMTDLAAVEPAVLAAAEATRHGGGSPERPDLTGFQVAAEMGDSHVGSWHLFLALIRDRQSVPARALARLVDLDQLDAAMVAEVNSPGFRGFKSSFGGGELLLPEGTELDSPLIDALTESLPEGARLGFNWRRDDGRPWIRVTQPGNPHEVLSAALTRLGRAS